MYFVVNNFLGNQKIKVLTQIGIFSILDRIRIRFSTKQDPRFRTRTKMKRIRNTAPPPSRKIFAPELRVNILEPRLRIDLHTYAICR